MYKIAIFLLAISTMILTACHKEDTTKLYHPKGMIFFYGKECPHCKIVETFLVKFDVEKKIKFARKEVYHNKTNLENLIQLVKSCDNQMQNIELPVLWTGKNCLIGDKKIISYFGERLQLRAY